MRSVALSLVFVLGLIRPAAAWGPEGHLVIAAIAQAHLTAAARAKVAALLGGDNLVVLDSDWADEIRDQRPETAAWHYVNIPLAAVAYDPRRDCRGGDCVVAQIERDERILANARAGASARAEALRFLIHFVGDIHQPLHAVADDRGGNDVVVYLRGKRSNLHRVWDNDTVGFFGADPMAAARKVDSGWTAAQRAAMSGGAPSDWANESLADARRIYAAIKGPDLPDDYARRQAGLTRDRLEKAGLRLAAILNRLLS